MSICVTNLYMCAPPAQVRARFRYFFPRFSDFRVFHFNIYIYTYINIKGGRSFRFFLSNKKDKKNKKNHFSVMGMFPPVLFFLTMFSYVYLKQ